MYSLKGCNVVIKSSNVFVTVGHNDRELFTVWSVIRASRLHWYCLTLWRPLLSYGCSYKASLPERVKPSLVLFLTSGHFDAQHWASECPDVKSYKWRLNPVWHKMLYSCTHMTTVDVKGLSSTLPLRCVDLWIIRCWDVCAEETLKDAW